MFQGPARPQDAGKGWGEGGIFEAPAPATYLAGRCFSQTLGLFSPTMYCTNSAYNDRIYCTYDFKYVLFVYSRKISYEADGHRKVISSTYLFFSSLYDISIYVSQIYIHTECSKRCIAKLVYFALPYF